VIFSLFKKNSKQFDYIIYLINDVTEDFCLHNEFIKSYSKNKGLSIPSQIEMKFFLVHLVSRYSYYIHGAKFQDKIFNTLCSPRVFASYMKVCNDYIDDREKTYAEFNKLPELYEEGLNHILSRTFKSEDLDELKLNIIAANFASSVNACNFEEVISKLNN